MKKRILALFLACCTLFLAVPMFVIASVAAETESALPETAETAFGPSHADTWPTRSNNVTSNKVNESAIFHGFWQVGYKKSATDFVLLNSYNTTNDSKGMLCDSGHNNPWGWGGMYLHTDDGRTQPWGQVLVPNYANCVLDVSVRYTAEYTGTVTLEIKDIYFSRANHAIAIFVDGKMVWPNDESAAEEGATAYYLDTEKWFADQKTVGRNYGTNNADNAVKTILAGLHINAGSVVEFVDRNTGVGDSGESQRGMHSMDFRVNYTAVEARHIQSSIGGRFEIYNDEGAETQTAASIGANAPLFYSEETFASKEAYKEYLQTVQKIRFLDDWSVGVIHSSTAEYQPIARRMFFCDKRLTATTTWDAQWGVTEAGYQSGLTSYINSNQAYSPWQRNFGTMYLNWNSMKTTMASTGDTAVAQAYLVPADGYATLSYSAISLNTTTNTKICVHDRRNAGLAGGRRVQ